MEMADKAGQKSTKAGLKHTKTVKITDLLPNWLFEQRIR